MSKDETRQGLDLDDALTPESLPRLALFLSAYLHEDLMPVHGSAARAAYDYSAEAELDELEELALDWSRLQHAARHLSLEQIRRALTHRFGCAWYPTSLEEIEAVGREFERALRE